MRTEPFSVSIAATSGTRQIKHRAFDDGEQLARAAVKEIGDGLRAALLDPRRRASLALSGGSTPKRTYELLATLENVDWSRVDVFWVDERAVGPTHDDSNFKMAAGALARLPGVSVNRMVGEAPSLPEAARDYAALLDKHVRAENGLPAFDVVVLGVGDDGHTASLFPGSPLVRAADRTVLDVPAEGKRVARLTLSAPVLQNAKNVVVLAAGAAKVPALSRLRAPAGSVLQTPARLLHDARGKVSVLTDRAAAGEAPAAAPGPREAPADDFAKPVAAQQSAPAGAPPPARAAVLPRVTGGGVAVVPSPEASGKLPFAALDASRPPAETVARLRAASGDGKVTLVFQEPGASLSQLMATWGPALQEGDRVVVSGTSDPAHVRPAVAAATKAGLAFVDATRMTDLGPLLVSGPAEEISGPLAATLAAVAGPREAKVVRVGNAGAATYVRAAHDAGARGMLQAYAEGMSILDAKRFGGARLDLGQIAEVWRRGSVVRASLLDGIAGRLQRKASLGVFKQAFGQLGTVAPVFREAMRLGVDLPAIFAAKNVDLAGGGRPSTRRPEASDRTAPPLARVGMTGPMPADAVKAIGVLGLGRMGGKIVERLVAKGQVTPVGYARHGVEEMVAATGGKAVGASSAQDLVEKVRARSPDGHATIWLMVGHDVVDSVLDGLRPFLRPGDTVIDGGNSPYQETQRRSAELAASGIGMVDVGTSGGVWGFDNGYSMMVGSDDPARVSRLRPVFESLAPAPNIGWGWFGPAGAGHYVKMVHNGVEYGTMQVTAEVLKFLVHASSREGLGIDLGQVVELWRDGTDMASWLLDLTAGRLPEMERVRGTKVTDNGEGRWTSLEGLDLGVPSPVLDAALSTRLHSQELNSLPAEWPRDQVGYVERLLQLVGSPGTELEFAL